MAAWHRSRRADVGLRAAGLLFGWIGYAAIARLIAMHVAPREAGLPTLAIAAVGFMAASAGSAMAALGRHLFDEVEVSARWRGRADPSVSIAAARKVGIDAIHATSGVASHGQGQWSAASAVVRPSYAGSVS
ncbi:hypothetical protein KZ810_04690 [Sphingomonas sp. RHCKR47]|uniref:hypothetical protein n=1 Tax=Sphingomonas citricola TaxID=2862498 RepID=UPI001CA4AB9B|nr:hypothetical protein [Sphingomonas citricola]MBW6522788.1 hypothetical protein [Sphingomonas citricola]